MLTSGRPKSLQGCSDPNDRNCKTQSPQSVPEGIENKHFLKKQTLSTNWHPGWFSRAVAIYNKKSRAKYTGLNLVHLQGLEPRTHWLRVSCSTNWAKGAYLIKWKSTLQRAFYLAGVVGIEPTSKVLETPILPLNHTPIGKKLGTNKIGAPSGTRPQDPLIKSQVLYQLS